MNMLNSTVLFSSNGTPCFRSSHHLAALLAIATSDPAELSLWCLVALRASGGTSLGELEFAYHLLAHHKFLGLTGCRHWKFCNEPDVTGDLEMGDSPLTEGANLLRRGRLPRLQNDKCADFFSKALIGNPKNLNGLHLGMLHQIFFDLAGIDILAPADKHVLDPANNVAETLAVEHGKIAGMHPAGGINGLRGQCILAPVAAHHRIASRA